MVTQAQKYHFLFRLWIKLRGLLILLIVLAGLIVGLLSLLLPFDSLYKERLEQFLAQQWGLQVKVDEIDGLWKGYGPYFALEGLELTGKHSVQLESANLFINVYQLLTPGGRTGIDLSINQAELDMIHSVDGASITINDDKDEARFTDMIDQILTTGSLRVDKMIFNVADETGGVIIAGLEADFLLEQDEAYRALQIQVENLLGESTVDTGQSIVLKSRGLKKQSLTRDAQWYLKFNQFKLSQLKNFFTNAHLPGGQLNGEIWLTAEAGSIQGITGELSWFNPDQDLGFDILVKQQVNEDQVFGNQLSSTGAKLWQALLKIQNIRVKGQQFADFEIMLQRDLDISQIKSTDIPMGLVAQIISTMDINTALDTKILDQTSGHINHLEISYNHTNNEWLGGYLDFSGLTVDHDRFKLRDLAGLFEFDTQQGALLLDSADGALSIENVYRGTLNWQQLNAQISIDWQQPVPNIKLNSFWCDCEDFDLQVWADVKLKENLNMILNSRLAAVEVASLHKYWPHNAWKEKTLNWLDQGLLGGQVEKGFVFVNGELIKQGFKKGAAKFISRAYTKGVDNQFHPEWPLVNGIDAVAMFDHDSVDVQLQQATSLGLNINRAQVDIDSFDTGIITVDMAANSKNNEILNYIRKSPLVKNIELDENIKIGGKQQVNLIFDVDLKGTGEKAFDPQGEVVFSDGQFFTEHFAIDEINGPVQLDGYRLLMADLQAQLNTAEVLLNGEIVTKSEKGAVVDVDLFGSLKTDYLLDLIQQDLPISGQSNWNINIKNLRKGLIMRAKSALSGVSIDLPAPFNKSAEESKTLEIICNIPCATSTVEINYNDEVKSTLNSKAGQYHLARLQFMESMQVTKEGSDHSDQLFGGSIDVLNLDQWLALLTVQNFNQPADTEQQTQPGSGKEWPVDEIQLNIKKMIFMSRAFEGIELNIKRLADGYAIDVDSEAIKGRVLIDDNLQQKGIVAEFEHLNWLDPIENLVEVTSGTTTTKIPDIHLWADQFSYAGIPLGSIRMEMRNVADGIKVEQLSLKSELAEIHVSGTWNKFAPGLGYSTFNIVMFSEKVADFLQTVGFNAPITNAQTLIEMQARWEGVPSQFNMATIDGDLDIKIGQGEVLDQNPGFGRVLGLFNLTNLPRRLILDFRDVLAEGLLFSSMEGKFEIEDGVAKTEDFLIKASSAKIHIEGDVGFADQSYNQTITIRPQIGKTFPTIGAIAGGPVGAAAGFLVQGLLDKQLKSSNEIIYHVTGTWDDPKIELIDKAQIDKDQ